MAATGSQPLIAGHPALDFTNSVGWHAGTNPDEKLHSYADLLNWAKLAGVLPARQLAALGRQARRSPSAGRSALMRAIEIREVFYRIFVAVAKGAAPTAPDLARLNAERVRALQQGSTTWSDKLVVSFARSTDLLTPVYPLLLAAVDLLRSPDLARVRQCANDPCGWLFIDRSKNHSRRWCASWDCGNETRVRRFRERARR